MYQATFRSLWIVPLILALQRFWAACWWIFARLATGTRWWWTRSLIVVVMTALLVAAVLQCCEHDGVWGVCFTLRKAGVPIGVLLRTYCTVFYVARQNARSPDSLSWSAGVVVAHFTSNVWTVYSITNYVYRQSSGYLVDFPFPGGGWSHTATEYVPTVHRYYSYDVVGMVGTQSSLWVFLPIEHNSLKSMHCQNCFWINCFCSHLVSEGRPSVFLNKGILVTKL